MKLLTRTSLNFISVCTVFFLLGSIVMYFSIKNIIQNDLESNLIQQKKKFISSLEKDKIHELKSDLVFISKGEGFQDLTFNDTVLIIDNQYVLFKNMQFSCIKEGINYRVNILKSQSQSDILIMKLVIVNIGFAMLFFLIVFYVNRHSIRSALKVFYSTINKLEGFQLNKPAPLKLDNAEVYEIKKLNNVFEKMSTQIKNDFDLQKEYTENVTHELQTPLSVISTKVDELMQSDNLNKEQMEQLAVLMETTNRLSKINKSLIFLTKIDNRFYSDKKKILINNLIDDKLCLFADIIDQRNIKIELDYKQDVYVEIDPNLAETILINLIKNAIIHNYNDGYIKILLVDNSLIISNSGDVPNFDKSSIFNRFTRNSVNSKSLGIGLSIVKRICDLYNFNIKYDYKDEHCFIINFN